MPQQRPVQALADNPSADIYERFEQVRLGTPDNMSALLRELGSLPRRTESQQCLLNAISEYRRGRLSYEHGNFERALDHFLRSESELTRTDTDYSLEAEVNRCKIAIALTSGDYAAIEPLASLSDEDVGASEDQYVQDALWLSRVFRGIHTTHRTTTIRANVRNLVFVAARSKHIDPTMKDKLERAAVRAFIGAIGGVTASTAVRHLLPIAIQTKLGNYARARASGDSDAEQYQTASSAIEQLMQTIIQRIKPEVLDDASKPLTLGSLSAALVAVLREHCAEHDDYIKDVDQVTREFVKARNRAIHDGGVEFGPDKAELVNSIVDLISPLVPLHGQILRRTFAGYLVELDVLGYESYKEMAAFTDVPGSCKFLGDPVGLGLRLPPKAPLVLIGGVESNDPDLYLGCILEVLRSTTAQFRLPRIPSPAESATDESWNLVSKAISASFSEEAGRFGFRTFELQGARVVQRKPIPESMEPALKIASYYAVRRHFLKHASSVEDTMNRLVAWADGIEQLHVPLSPRAHRKLILNRIAHDWSDACARALADGGNLAEKMALVQKVWKELQTKLAKRGAAPRDTDLRNVLTRRATTPTTGLTVVAGSILDPLDFMSLALRFHPDLLEKGRSGTLFFAWAHALLTRKVNLSEHDIDALREQLRRACEAMDGLDFDDLDSMLGLAFLSMTVSTSDAPERAATPILRRFSAQSLLVAIYDNNAPSLLSLQKPRKFLLEQVAAREFHGLDEDSVVEGLRRIIAPTGSPGRQAGIERSIRHYLFGGPRN